MGSVSVSTVVGHVGCCDDLLFLMLFISVSPVSIVLLSKESLAYCFL